MEHVIAQWGQWGGVQQPEAYTGAESVLKHAAQPWDCPGSGKCQRPEMRNGSLLRLDLLEGPLWSVMPLKDMCGSVVLMQQGLRLMSETCVIT